MLPRLADLLNEPSLGLACVTGHQDLNRQVSWVHVAEVNDPSPWLTRGVLLLTTGLVRRSEAELDAYFAGLASRGVSAVGFGVGLIVDEIPPSWRRAADTHRIPLLRIPLATPYIAISEFVSHRIAETQLDQVRRMLDVQQRLAYSDPTPDLQMESLEKLARELDAVVVWRAPDGEPRTAAGDASGDVELQADELSAVLAELPRHSISGRRSTSVSIGSLYVHVISTAGSPLAVVRRRRYTPLEQSLIGSVAVFIALSRSVAALPDFTSSFREQILTEAIAGQVPASERLFEILLPHAETCTVAYLGPSPEPGVRSRREPAAGLLVKAHLANTLPDAGARVPPLLSSVGDGFYLLLPGSSPEAVRTAVGAFLQGESGNLGTWRAGVSRARPPAETLEMCGEAELAQRATRYREAVPILEFSQLTRRERVADWLPSSLDAPVFGEWSARIEALEPAAARRALQALHAFLQENGAVERAAARLGVHRQTLNSHLREAEHALDVSLASPTERSLLWLAFESGALRAPDPGEEQAAIRRTPRSP